ncbi:MAG: DNA-processing protein DprA, partial [Solirubrobacterales bacterium]|nr:DNA-processing protein DprA [Solirubrobacterales bacterium]
ATAIAVAGVVVVSGLAQGFDSAAHAAALDAHGDTVAVLGEGLAAFDPHGRRRRLAAAIRDRGCLVSQYEPLFAAQGWMFAKRNATIAALARAVVVVEAPHGSGALITAADGLALRRDVYAVPGPLSSVASAGSNELIATGRARALTGPGSLGLHATAPEHDEVLERLAAGPLSLDTLGADGSHIAELLLDGRIVRLADGRLARR